ncbi:hypothetical protein [Chryseobacterium echinoideorum]|uniref:hypothetical protein n=1 Tax=Chryseobacterium echinoideorum TaxID=1549648 RepID=UPI0011856776|nr:hypothetical protein [Chryseobacterium echinoideorum]
MQKKYSLEIEKYLKSKNLSHEIFDELYDHFVLQIDELMKEGISFQEAFLKVKIRWQHELKMVRSDWFSFKKIAKIEKNILQNRFRKITQLSVLVSFLTLLLYFIVPESLLYIVILIAMCNVITMAYHFVCKKITFREYLFLSYHPLIVRNQILVLVIFSVVYLFDGNMNFWEPALNQILIVFIMMIQLQLLYFKNKKINILLA